ncbi:Carbohydrate kinase PfkB [Trinorchestia longiramus]|nr:Carbohydrate kinase PfkB [Trinorchestia longiramus]
MLSTKYNLVLCDVQYTGRTHQGAVTQNCGGVGRNLADSLTRLGVTIMLLSAVGTDAHADTLTTHSPPGLMGLGTLRQDTAPTASYCALLDSKGEAMLGVGNMDVHNHITPQWVRQFSKEIASSQLVVCDGNIPQPTLDCTLQLCAASDVPVSDFRDTALQCKEPHSFTTSRKIAAISR